jgi:hypothetical protein
MHSWPRRILVFAALLMLASAAVVAFGVIPAVRADTYPSATPDRAVPAFWVNAVLTVLGAAAALACLRVAASRATLRRALSGVPGLLALLLGLVLIDAATAYPQHGPAMHGAVVALWVCAGFDLLAGASLLGLALVWRRWWPEQA